MTEGPKTNVQVSDGVPSGDHTLACYTDLPRTRADAFMAINLERDYQDEMQGNARRENVDDNRELGSLITLIDQYLFKVKAGFAGPHPEGKNEALDQMRKVAALAVLAMETHGVLFR